MCIRDRISDPRRDDQVSGHGWFDGRWRRVQTKAPDFFIHCLLYTSDAADERSSVDLGGRRIIKKKKSRTSMGETYNIKERRE